MEAKLVGKAGLNNEGDHGVEKAVRDANGDAVPEALRSLGSNIGKRCQPANALITHREVGPGNGNWLEEDATEGVTDDLTEKEGYLPLGRYGLFGGVGKLVGQHAD